MDKSRSRFTLILIFVIFYFISVNVVEASNEPQKSKNTQKQSLRRAQAARPEVEIYQKAHFDSEIITTINPGKFYLISNKVYGPFYKIKISDKVIGYVADTEVDIEGVGILKEKPFLGDKEDEAPKNKKSLQEEADSEDAEPELERSYREFSLSIINYHEKTMGQTQVADLWAIGYRYIPFLSDFSSSISWDFNLSLGIPSYYKDKLNVNGSGGTLWGGPLLTNIIPYGTSKTVHYGLGPFLKYSNYNLETVNDKYSLQDLNAGFLFEGGFIYHFNKVAVDLSLKYYWEKASYGALSFGFLF